MEWKTIPNTNGRYLCNKQGDIKRIEGIVNFGSQQRKVGGNILKPKTKSNGYQEVSLQLKNQGGKSRYVHRLIVETWLGGIPPKMAVNHKDGIKSNNKLDNLEIVTYSENLLHAVKIGLHKSNPRIGSEHPNAKTNEKEVLKIRHEHGEHKSIRKLISDYPHLTKPILTKIVYRQSWKHI